MDNWLVDGRVMQVAFVVDDIERELDRWTRELRVGPFFYVHHFPIVEAQYRGEATTLDVDVALAFSGSMCIELIRQNNAAASPYRDTTGPEGWRHGAPHHYAVPTRNFDADSAQRVREGQTLVASGKVAVGGRVAYFSSRTLPALIELIEITPQASEFFAMVHGAAQSWDGSEPVRRLGP